jgi:NOL1/NOP2/sun family putative RNA methylase
MIPDFLLNKLKETYPEDYEKITEGYNSNRVNSLRINTIKSNKEEIISILKENNISYEPVTWYQDALIINDDLNKIKELNIYKEGKVYFQSLSSMIPPLVVNPKSNELILDMTAAPGGKTTQIAALSNNTAMITATEKNKIRNDRLKYNIEKQGAKKVSVLNVDARKLDEYFMFDKILLDAPCSGSGTLLNSTPNDFTEDLVLRSINFQKELIKEAIKHLNKNGELIYSTCSILKEENEEVLKTILEDKSLSITPIIELDTNDIPLLPSTIEGVITVCPTEYFEGFFVAKIKKQ